MVIVCVMGGAGGQMQGYALARKLKELNKEVYLDISSYKQWEFRYDYCLDRIFNLDKEIKVIENLNSFLVNHPEVNRRIDTTKRVCYDESIFQYDNVYHIGYWPIEKYFEGVEDILRKEYTFINDLNEENAALLNEINKENSVSIQIRRGDYMAVGNAEVFNGNATIKYYENAASYIEERVENPVYYVFTDDVDWTLNNIKLKNMKVIKAQVGKENYLNIQLMSSCKHNILANSGASWWAGWLNNNPDKIVISPKKWLNVEWANNEEVISKGWLTLDS